MKKRLVILLLLAGCSNGGSDTPPIIEPPKLECMASITWRLPIQRVNGDLIPVNEISKSTIYVSSIESTEDQFIETTIDIDIEGITTWEIENLDTGEHWFYLNITDLQGLTSRFSNIMGKVCP